MPVPPPRYTLQQYKDQFRNHTCSEEQRRHIFEDYDDMDGSTNEQIDGWSFVGDAAK